MLTDTNCGSSVVTSNLGHLLIMTAIRNHPNWEIKPASWSAVAVIFLIFIGTPRTFAQQPIVLIWPVACKLGETCFVQNFVDHDPGDAVKDYRCGSRTYNGHEGTDIRLTDMQAEQAGVGVLASADGRVVGTRDGVDDISVRVTGLAAVAGKECGNGVLIDHGQGWSTQYCHLKNGSIIVTPGQTVTAGTQLGQVGLSGETEFPHLHMTVRHNGTIIDPFAFDEPADACSGGSSLWATQISEKAAYQEREILNFGFSSITPTMENIESGTVRQHPPDTKSDALVAYVRSIGLRKGDEQIISVKFPDGRPFAEYRVPPLETNKAQFFALAGQRRKNHDWPAGTYETTFRVISSGKEVLLKTFSLALP
jgi:hypothetical protein